MLRRTLLAPCCSCLSPLTDAGLSAISPVWHFHHTGRALTPWCKATWLSFNRHIFRREVSPGTDLPSFLGVAPVHARPAKATPSCDGRNLPSRKSLVHSTTGLPGTRSGATRPEVQSPGYARNKAGICTRPAGHVAGFRAIEVAHVVQKSTTSGQAMTMPIGQEVL